MDSSEEISRQTYLGDARARRIQELKEFISVVHGLRMDPGNPMGIQYKLQSAVDEWLNLLKTPLGG